MAPSVGPKPPPTGAQKVRHFSTGTTTRRAPPKLKTVWRDPGAKTRTSSRQLQQLPPAQTQTHRNAINNDGTGARHQVTRCR
jgi:hypothetical protein